MRHIKQYRQILACLPALLAAAAAFWLSSEAMAQRDYRPSSEEEHSTPAVDALKDALKIPVDSSNKEELEFRKRILQERVNTLQGLRELYLALLQEWGDELDREDAAVAIDRAIHEQVANRFARIIRDGLKSGNPDQQFAAANFLAEAGAKIRSTGNPRGLTSSLAPDLAALLKERKPGVAESAARALGRINPDPQLAAPALQGLLKTGSASERRAAADALVSLIQVVELLSKDKGGRGVRASSQDILSNSQTVVNAAGAGLKDADPVVRRLCALAVQRAGASLVELISTPRSASALPPAGRKLSDIEKKEIQDYQAEIQREQADEAGLARALSEQGPALASLLQDDEPDTRVIAARALGEMANAQTRLVRQTESIPALEPAPAHPAPASGAETSLRNALKASLPSLKKALSDPDVRVRLAAVTALEMLDRDAAGAVDALVKALKDRDIFLRWAAARTLGNIDPAVGKVAVPSLAKLLFDPDLDPRLAAASTLEHYGNLAGDAVPELSRAIGVGDAEIRIAVIRALEAIGPESKSAVSALAKALENPDDRVRQAAAEALGRLGPLAQPALPSLRKALDDPSGNVRKAAGAALIDVTRKQ
jgi:HEAT repeat protein